MSEKSFLFVVTVQVTIFLLWSNGILSSPVSLKENEGEIADDYTCGNLTCSEGHHCELFLVECIRAPCPPIRQCVETTGITCANVRCAGRCFMKKFCDESGCRDGPACVPWNNTDN